MSEVNDHDMEVDMINGAARMSLFTMLKRWTVCTLVLTMLYHCSGSRLGKHPFPAACGYSGNQRNALLGTRRNSQTDYRRGDFAGHSTISG